MNPSSLKSIRSSLEGELYSDGMTRLMYSTDASVYREIPLAVARPKTAEDIKKLIYYAKKEKTSLIPRAAGTSLAGQCVGNGIVVDISKNFNRIIELNEEEKWVRVEPGVILSELNKYLEPYSLFFGPEASTANRCMTGGMVGNNSCGLHSMIYGSTREHTLEIKALLSDGTEALFKNLTKDEFNEKCKGENLENRIYSSIRDILDSKEISEEINKVFPLKSIPRRNSGYALDLLLDDYQEMLNVKGGMLDKIQYSKFKFQNSTFNLCKLLCGSEGTLAFITEIKLNLVPLSKKPKALLCLHLNSVEDATYANIIALKHKPTSVELVDKKILDLTKENIEQKKNRFFINGDPGAILIIELEADSKEMIINIANDIISDMNQSSNFRLPESNFHPPLVWGNDMSRVWNLRNAGLGVLANMPGDSKPQPVIEDAAVDVNSLPDFFKDFQLILDDLNLTSTYYAHIGTGEIHIRPIINLKTEEGVRAFREVGERMARLVKKYRGSLSGEHGDGRLRGEFIEQMFGEKLFKVFKEIKHQWDPENIFNPGKIVDTPPMDTCLRYEIRSQKPEARGHKLDTIMDFSDTDGMLRAIEKCNGTADCRKTMSAGGTMCPSYMATKDEKDSTRGRANILREYFSNGELRMEYGELETLKYDDVLKVLDLCLSCKGCKAECPSNIDMALYKAEFFQHYYDTHRVPVRTKLFAYITQINRLGLRLGLFNFIVNRFTGRIIKSIAGIAYQRNLPKPNKITLTKWYKKNYSALSIQHSAITKKREVILYVDEFLEYNDVEIGIKAIKLLIKLGFEVRIFEFRESGRTFISKGLLRKAKKIANENIEFYRNKVSDDKPLIGIEPSAILSFRDEYLRFADKELREDAVKLSENCFLIDEFLAQESSKFNVQSSKLANKKTKILLHGHCHQKVLASIEPSKKLLSLIPNTEVEVVPSGCCGMAGSFGYEKEHFDVSMKIGELVLFPAVRNSDAETIISAPGTSCRQQIFDGTGRKAYHPIEILYERFADSL
jgi:FAD/FMN-containing dehydrogenase/Fe-S oxidoreductase